MTVCNFFLSAKVIFWLGSWKTRATELFRLWWIASPWYVAETGTALLLV